MQTATCANHPLDHYKIYHIRAVKVNVHYGGKGSIRERKGYIIFWKRQSILGNTTRIVEGNWFGWQD